MENVKQNNLFTEEDLENANFITSVLEVMASMSNDTTIDTKYIAEITGQCSGKMKQLNKKILDTVYN